ncbi:MAG TPA: class I SAM-dependent methyltransferase [Candidatus Absconditabacterales bacterium]|nr:class I SAM-dependent methyltransferase [Candidatus Absconditabacterales bacterium]
MNFLKLRKSCMDRDIPIISQETEKFLGNLLEQHKPKVCLEIGSAVGYSSIFLSNTIKKWGGFLYSFEISYASYLEGIQNIGKHASKNLIVYPFDFLKIDLKKLIPNTVDFVFIDGQKSQYANYLMNIIGVAKENKNILSPKNIIVFDDVIKFKSKMSSLYGYLEKKQIVYKEIKTEKGDGVILINNG